MATSRQTRIARSFFRMFDADMDRIEEVRHQAASCETEKAAEAGETSAASRACVSTTGGEQEGRGTAAGQDAPSGQLSDIHSMARS
jgi:hypothetical protein